MTREQKLQKIHEYLNQCFGDECNRGRIYTAEGLLELFETMNEEEPTENIWDIVIDSLFGGKAAGDS